MRSEVHNKQIYRGYVVFESRAQARYVRDDGWYFEDDAGEDRGPFHSLARVKEVLDYNIDNEGKAW